MQKMSIPGKYAQYKTYEDMVAKEGLMFSANWRGKTSEIGKPLITREMFNAAKALEKDTKELASLSKAQKELEKLISDIDSFSLGKVSGGSGSSSKGGSGGGSGGGSSAKEDVYEIKEYANAIKLLDYELNKVKDSREDMLQGSADLS